MDGTPIGEVDVRVLRRSELQASDGAWRDDGIEIFVRYLEASPGAWVAEADAPPARIQAATLSEARRRMGAALARSIGTGALGQATLIEDLPDDAGDAEEEGYARLAPEGAEDGPGEDEV